MKPALHHESEDCRAVSDILGRVGDKWTVLVVGYLSAGPMRFSELKRCIGGISQKMLSQTLRELETHGLVQRIDHRTVPPHVEYRLTDLGHSLSRALEPVDRWAEQHLDAVLKAKQTSA